jgi:hypothetical protein
MKRKPKTVSASKPARTGRDLARDFAILIREFCILDLTLRGGRMLQEKLKFGTQPTFDRNGLGNPSAVAQIFGCKTAQKSASPKTAALKLKAKRSRAEIW